MLYIFLYVHLLSHLEGIQTTNNDRLEGIDRVTDIARPYSVKKTCAS